MDQNVKKCLRIKICSQKKVTVVTDGALRKAKFYPATRPTRKGFISSFRILGVSPGAAVYVTLIQF